MEAQYRLDRTTLEERSRDELRAILESLGGTARFLARKRELIDQVLSIASQRELGRESESESESESETVVDLLPSLERLYGRDEVLTLARAVKDVIGSHVAEDWTGDGEQWDVIANEVASRLGSQLPGIETYLEPYLRYPEFRVALEEWSRAADDEPAAGVGAEARLTNSAIAELAELNQLAAEAALAELQAVAPALGTSLRLELPFEDEQARRVWRLLDPRSPLAFRPAEARRPRIVPELPASRGRAAASSDVYGGKQAETVVTSQSPVAKGKTLEDSLRAVLATLFDLDHATGWKLRQQASGTQYGFDVSFSAPDALGRSMCLFECKNYTTGIGLSVIADKLLQAELHWKEVPIDHWILVSPHTDPVNELDQAVEVWNANQRWPFRVQIWSPNSGIADLFRLDPKVHEALYGTEPPELEPAHSGRIVDDFRCRLEPPLRIPSRLATYAARAEPLLLPTDDASWSSLLGRHIPRSAFTEAGAPAASSLLGLVSGWCADNQKKSTALLLLADFGEGKSFFTYELCAELLTRFRANPRGNPLPLRFTLRDFRGIDSPRDFLDWQLGYFGASFADLGELRSTSSCVLILDGVDEMSVRQDGQATTENLHKLQELLQLTNDIPVVLTSRPHFFESSTNRRRFYDRLRRPLVYLLGQPSRSERLDHLHEFAKATGSIEKLRRIKALYDPIGLAAKVLFLEMLKATLPDLPDDDFSETVLYDTYIDSALRRKIDLLDDVAASVSHDELVESLKDLLNAVALKLHQSGEGTVDLRRFTDDKSTLAEALWRVSQPSTDDASYDVSTDAAARVGMRSLLKRVGDRDDETDEWRVEFSHRSLKEFFVARAIATKMCSPLYEPEARTLLRALHLEPVILHFFGQFDLGVRSTILGRLRSFIGSAIRGNDNGLLGGNALSCFAALGGATIRETFSDLDLDNALLARADLHGTSLQGSTLRWAVLDNADLTDADLRSADLTGVRLEETSGVLSLTRGSTGDEVLALYDDGSLRRWSVHEGGRTSYEVVIQSLPAGYKEVVVAGELLILLGPLGAAMWRMSADGGPSHQVARFPSDNRIRRVSVLGATMALVSEDDHGRLSLSAVSLHSGATMWTTSCAADVLAMSGRLITAVVADGVVVYDVSSGDPVARCDINGHVGALALRDERTIVQLAIVTSNGDLSICEVRADGSCEVIASALELHDSLATAATWLDVGVASGGGGRQILVTRQAQSQVVVDAVLQRELRCNGANVSGLMGPTERQTLLRNGARESPELP